MPFELEDPTNTLLREIAMPETTRDTLAKTYALAINLRPIGRTRWPAVNDAIRTRWSRSGLEYIKRKAWKIADEGREKSDEAP